MRLVLVNWARIWDGASSGGGVNGYVQALALALAARGHDVVSLCGGTAYTAQAPGGEIGPCRIVRHPDWMGARVFEVVNSPVLAPAIAQFREPAAEAGSPALEALLAEFFAALRPDAVHFHNIEGFSAGCIDAAAAAGAAVVYSLHNYHTICPQVYLMQGHRTPCFDAEGGRRCAGCIEAGEPGVEAARRAAENAPAAVVPEPAPAMAAAPRLPLLGRLWGREVRGQKSEVRGLESGVRGQESGGSLGAAPPPADLAAPYPHEEPDMRGKTAFLRGELRPREWPSPLDPEWQAVANTPARDPSCGAPVNGYGERREAMVAALNRCDAVLAVSEFVRCKFEAMGVDPSRLRTLHIGTRAAATAERHAELLFDPPPFDPARPRPIRLVFMGINHWYKGLPMLADSLELLTPEYLRRVDLSVHAAGIESIEWRFRRLEPRLAGLTIGHAFESHDIPWICGGRDAGLVPSVWWDNAPQTVFEFLACGLPVIAADLGGIPDFIRHGENGLLFRGNDRFDLARTLVGLIREPATLGRLRAGVRPPKRIEEHAAEVEAVYRQCGPGGRPGA